MRCDFCFTPRTAKEKIQLVAMGRVIPCMLFSRLPGCGSRPCWIGIPLLLLLLNLVVESVAVAGTSDRPRALGGGSSFCVPAFVVLQSSCKSRPRVFDPNRAPTIVLNNNNNHNMATRPPSEPTTPLKRYYPIGQPGQRRRRMEKDGSPTHTILSGPSCHTLANFLSRPCGFGPGGKLWILGNVPQSSHSLSPRGRSIPKGVESHLTQCLDYRRGAWLRNVGGAGGPLVSFHQSVGL